MKAQLNPYLSFKDNTREVMEYYKSVFGGGLVLRTFKDFKASKDPSEDDLIMHSVLEVSSDLMFMASDTPVRLEYKPGNNFSMSLTGDDEAKLSDYFEKLSQGGNITMPLEKSMWGDKFGMVIDKYGIQWLVNISQNKEA